MHSAISNPSDFAEDEEAAGSDGSVGVESEGSAFWGSSGLASKTVEFVPSLGV